MLTRGNERMDCYITWIGQAGYIIELDDVSFCIDPYLSDSVEQIEGFKRLVQAPVSAEQLNIDYMLFTHDHLDHFDEPTIIKTIHKHITYIGPESCVARLNQLGAKKIIRLDRYNTIEVGNVGITATYAYHTDDSIGLLFRIKNKQGGGLYITGDTEYSEELLKVKKQQPAVLVVCINGKLGNMNVNEAAKLAVQIGVNQVIPCHYGMFAENTEDPKKLESSLKDSGIVFSELELMKKYKFNI
jgi:L-ascorbate 6-phosphate lactonase